MPFDTPGIDPALEGSFTVDGIEVGADQDTITHKAAAVRPAFAHLVDHVKTYTPEWAAKICDVPAASIRRVTNEFLAHARVGETIEIEGMTLPFRPVSITFGKTVNNGWGGYECCWARTLIPCLLGALDVPGGTLGTTVRLNRPADNRWSSVKPGPGRVHGLSDEPDRQGRLDFASDRAQRASHAGAAGRQFGLEPGARADASRLDDAEGGFQKPPARAAARRLAGLSHQSGDFVLGHQSRRRNDGEVSVHRLLRLTRDETNHVADVLLPDCTDLEGLQLLRIGGTKYVEQFWDHQGFALARSGGAAAGRGE